VTPLVAFAVIFGLIILMAWIQSNTLALVAGAAGMAMCIILLTGTAVAR
jgi:hypothetical protein